jgi:hypothetical protein
MCQPLISKTSFAGMGTAPGPATSNVMNATTSDTFDTGARDEVRGGDALLLASVLEHLTVDASTRCHPHLILASPSSSTKTSLRR